MENTLEKLKCLNYEEHLIHKSWKKPIASAYFLVPDSNAKEQFQIFVLLVKWLFSLIRDYFDEPSFQIDQYQESHTIIQNVIKELKALNYEGNTSASKLKLAYGEEVILVLDFLTDLALSKTNYIFLAASHHTTEDMLEESNHIFSEGHQNDAKDFSINEAENNDIQNENSMIIAKIDPVEWKTELERIGPKLRGKIA